MTSRLAELEAGLVEDGRWNLDQLAVYADHLHAGGDPRGELILLDLHGGPEVADRRRELLEQFLGEHAANPAVHCRHGFVDLDLDDRSDRTLVARLGRLAGYLREVRVIGTAETIVAAIDTLAIAPRPWLTTLAIYQRGIGPRPVLRRDVASALAIATPRLDTLDISGNAVFASFEHAALRVLRLTALDGILSLENGTEMLPGVRELDLRLSGRQLSDDDYVRRLAPAALPALRRLDLSRNASSADTDPFRFLRFTPLAPQLTELRLPALQSPGDHANVQAALEHMPGLHRIEVPPGPLQLAHPSAVIAERARPWHPLNRTIAAFAVDGTVHRVVLADAAAWLDDHYERMPDDARAAWNQLWHVLLREPRGLPRSRSVVAARLVLALDACHGQVWAELRTAVRAIDHGPSVVVPLL